MAPKDPTEAPETGPLTARQRRIVDFIASTVRERAIPAPCARSARPSG